MSSANSIFISYRRSDSQDVTGRIHDRLSDHFTNDLIFRDVDSIPYGDDFQITLQESVSNCLVLVAVIGPTWFKVLQERMQRPQTDWVRTEIALALQRNIPVIPVLTSGAQMPGANDLPEDLKALAPRNAAQARAGLDFHVDMDRLIQRLESVLKQSGSPEPLKLSTSQKLKLERLRSDLQAKERDYKAVAEDLKVELDAPTKNRLQDRLSLLEKELDDLEQEIAAIEQGSHAE